MNTGADVRSIDALREWLGALHTYRHTCEESLAGIRMEIQRGFAWIDEQERLWQKAIRDCQEEVVQAKADLAARRFPDFAGRMPDTTVQERNLRRAEARLEHAEDQVKRCRKWSVQLPKLIDELYTSAGHNLGTFLEGDLTQTSAQLVRQVEALEAYAGTRIDYAPTPTLANLPSKPITEPEPEKPQ